MSATTTLTALCPLATTTTAVARGSVSLEWVAIGAIGLTLTGFLTWYFFIRKSGTSE